jgi:hypothetical protein
MKKHITIFIFCLATLMSVAQVRTGSFKLNVNNNYNSQRSGTILIDGQQNFQQNLENILIANMLPGNYILKIYYKNTPNGQEISINRNFTIESGKTIDFTFGSSGTLNFKYLLDNNSIDIMPLSANGNKNDRDKRDYDRDNHGKDKHHNEPAVLPAPVSISQSDFYKIVNSIKNEKFEDAKIKTLKTACDFYPFFKSEQVQQLIELLPFEDGKLDCAKYLAPKVIDFQNLPLIKDAFTYSSTKDKWLEFLRRL